MEVIVPFTLLGDMEKHMNHGVLTGVKHEITDKLKCVRHPANDPMLLASSFWKSPPV